MDFNTGDQLIRHAMEIVLRRGSIASPRGKTVKELCTSPTVLSLSNPKRPFLMSRERRPNYRFGMAEALWILSGSDDAKLIAEFNKNMLNYSDDGRTLWGAYGPRLIGQLPHALDVLRRDPDTRQAVVQTWRPHLPCIAVDPACWNSGAKGYRAVRSSGMLNESEIAASESPTWNGASWESKDIPCTVTWHFMIRDGALNLNVYMRSNDVWFGLPYDLLSFTTIQRVVAAMLNVDVGVYNHIVGNLHLYEEHWEPALRVLSSVQVSRVVPDLPDFKEVRGCDLENVRNMAEEILTSRASGQFNGFSPYIAAVNRDRSDSVFGPLMKYLRGR